VRPPERILVTCEHAGHRVPARYARRFAGARGALESHRGWDAGALELARWLARRLGAPLHATTVSRLVIDANRSLHHPRLLSEFTRGLGREERERLVARHYLPHRRALEARVARWVRGGERVLHLAVHSFDPDLAPRRGACDLALLYDPRRVPERALCRRWRTALRAACPSLGVRLNFPYRGAADGLTTHLRRRFPARAYLGVEIEANRERLTGAPGDARRLRGALAASAQALGLAAGRRRRPAAH
jgi:predicted N-formylglutamate amidohydrolase